MPSDAALRKQARTLGLRLIKSRVRKPHLHNGGQYQLVDAHHRVVAGARFELTLIEVHGFLTGTAAFRGNQ